MVLKIKECHILEFSMTMMDSGGSFRNKMKKILNHKHIDGSLLSFSYEAINLNQKPRIFEPQIPLTHCT